MTERNHIEHQHLYTAQFETTLIMQSPNLLSTIHFEEHTYCKTVKIVPPACVLTVDVYSTVKTCNS